jgi:hypothetical protein
LPSEPGFIYHSPDVPAGSLPLSVDTPADEKSTGGCGYPGIIEIKGLNKKSIKSSFTGFQNLQPVDFNLICHSSLIMVLYYLLSLLLF